METSPLFYDIPKILGIIETCSDQYKLDKELVTGLIIQESGFEIWATRYEPNFYRRYLANKERKDLNGFVPTNITLNTEKVHRSTSWGLMQIMGETARANDFVGHLPTLLFPERNIEIGCKFLAKLYNKDAHLSFDQMKQSKFFETFFKVNPLLTDSSETRTLMALLRYNGGGNLNYPHEVIKKMGSQVHYKQ